MKTFATLVLFFAVANARSFLLPSASNWGPNQPGGIAPGYLAKPAIYPVAVRPSITRPAVVEEPTYVIEEEVEEEEAPLPCNPDIVGIITHPEENVDQEIIVPAPSRPGTFYPVIVNPPQNKPSILLPVVNEQQRPAVVPVGPNQQQKPAITPTGPIIIQERPAITPTGPVQQRPSITPTGPQQVPETRPAPVQPCALPVEEEEEQVEEEVIVSRPQTRPQILPAVIRPAVVEQQREPVAVVVEGDGSLRPVYDFIR